MDHSFEHYYTPDPQSELTVSKARLVLKNGHEYLFSSPSGVFSYGHVDRASRVLVEHAEISGHTLLDLGCGYGAVGITIAKEYPKVQLSMSDINSRAVKFAKINAKNHNLLAEVAQGSLYAPWQDCLFDMILSNPPMAAGKHVWMELIDLAPAYLNPHGLLQIVAFHNKGGQRLMNRMKEVFGNVKSLVKSGGIWVYRSQKRDDPS